VTPEAWFTVGVVLLVMALLSVTRIATDVVLFAALSLVLIAGVVSPAEALAGFANPGLATVAVMYAIVAGLVDTGAVQAIGQLVLGRPRSTASAQARLMLPVAAVSAFMNNTPVVAMLLPVVQDWCKRYQLSTSRLLMPLSYAAVLGGTCSLIGTSTNLVVHGLVLERTDLGRMGFFEIAGVGIPVALAGLAYVLVASRWLLPERRAALLAQDNQREYVIELLVEAGSPVVGKTIEEAGLRHLPGLFLAEVERAGKLIPAVAPTDRLYGGDRLMFVGVVESVVDLVKIKGLVPAADQVFKLEMPRPERRLIEAVVSNTAPVVGRTVREGRFRSRYGAVIIAVARDGERVRGKVGDIVLQPGDTLLLEARPAFVERNRNSRDFLLVSEIQGQAAPRHERAVVALGALAAMVLAAATGILDMLAAAMLGAGLMLVMRCTTPTSIRATVDWSVLCIIGASFGLGAALQATGAAGAVASSWLAIAGDNPWLTLAAVYVLTNVVTELITNNAAAVLMFPIAAAAAESLGVSLWPFVITIMMAASAGFATPLGYQTHTMVYGAGGYRFTDFVRFGLPLNVITGAIAITVIPLVWEF